MQYKMSTNVAKLIDARVMERNYADMVFQDSDLPTKIVGFEAIHRELDIPVYIHGNGAVYLTDTHRIQNKASPRRRFFLW